MPSILITGGTGYFGQGMVKRLLSCDDMHRICIYSRDEAKQATMRASLKDPYDRIRWFVGDVRDQSRLRRALDGVEIVMHAAALKRVEVGEYNPAEMVKTNIMGTMNLIEAATDAKVKKVVALSTDKACHPVNAYGASKLMLEKLILGANNTRGQFGPMFAVTRYGNVAGSTGSVIPNWRACIKAGAPLIITDPDATRFWMTLDQAIDLVIKTAQDMMGGELAIPTLPAYRLGDLLDAIVVRMPDNVRTVGLGPGEKKHELMDERGSDSSVARRMTVEELREALKSV